LEVFTDPRLLEAYAARWVPSRAVCYRELMAALPELREVLLGLEGDAKSGGSEGRNDVDGIESGDSDDSDEDQDKDEEVRGGDKAVTELSQRATKLRVSDGARTALDANTDDSQDTTSAEASSSSAPSGHVLSLGGGAGSELLALASVLKAAPPSLKGKERAWSWTGLDIGSWGAVLDEFSNALRAEWQLDLPATYIQGDMLASLPSTTSDAPPSTGRPEDEPSHRPVDISSILTAKPPTLITLLFTLTELFSQSRPATLRFLHLITAHVPPGTLLLVADSASDISEFAIGSAGRKWPVWMILDMALTTRQEGKGAEWEKVRGEDSRWYRLPEGVGAGWPVKLENTRYWYRLYRRA
jgi:25S rRNA (uracil2843-N3)-methyltransferase